MVKFGEVDVSAAAGNVLAHSAKTPSGRIAKGTVLGGKDIEALAAAGKDRVVVATLEKGDVAEDEAADRVARSLAGEHLRVDKPRDGRANLYAEKAGLFRVDAAGVGGLNAVDPAVTLATLRDREHVLTGRLVATVKVIPFAVARKSVEVCEGLGVKLSVSAYRGGDVALVQTKTASIRDEVLDKTRRVTEGRLSELGSKIAFEERCSHDPEKLAEAVGKACESEPDILLVSCASAVSDRRDVLPAAIDAVGGEVRSVGMPVDPGNLLVLGRVGKTAVIGMPSCARSPKPNGFDWVLRRLCAGECVTGEDVSGMGVGGLLDEIHARTMPRAPHTEDRGFAAVLLAAGKSTRMGDRNKLLEQWRGRELVCHAAAALQEAREGGTVARVLVVTGHEAERVASVCGGLGLEIVHNERYETGMASSLKAGVAALGEEVDGVIVCLGDMPGVTPSLLAKLVGAFSPEEGKDIVVPVFGKKRGHPVLFGARHFPGLSALEGDHGARSVIEANADAVAEVEADESVLVDLDDPEAFREDD